MVVLKYVTNIENVAGPLIRGYNDNMGRQIFNGFNIVMETWKDTLL